MGRLPEVPTTIADPRTSTRPPELGARFEEQLGDACAGGPFSWAAAVARDEDGSFPDESLSMLHELGAAELYVPRALGGALDSFEQPLAFARALARRDPALALSAGMGIWSQLVFAAGTDAQRVYVRDQLRAGAMPCLAVSERDHGADLLASEVSAREAEGGWVLDGVKWPIGAATRASLALVLARTEEAAGPRSLSWLMLDGDALAAVERLPAVRTLGMRAADVGGLAFRSTRAPANALVGARGRGLELTLGLFQITRPLATAFALGAADSALRIATAFASGRALYRGRAIDLPNVEDALVGAYVDLLAAEAVARAAVRGLHTHPGESSVASAVAKVIAPELTGRAIRASSEVLGARFYLRHGIASGIFQKLLRDQLVVGLFDGSTGVCLQALAAQLPLLLDGRPRSFSTEGAARFALDRPLPAFDAARLAVGARDDFVLHTLGDAALPAALRPPRDAVLDALVVLRSELAGLRARGPAAARSALPFHLARRYAVLHAAAACLQLSGALDGVPSSWSLAAVERLLHPDAPLRELLDESDVAELRRGLEGSVAEPRALSLTPTPLFDSPLSDALSREVQ